MGGGGVPCKRRRDLAEAHKTASLDPSPKRAEFAMNAPKELNHEEVLRVKLEVMRREHRDLDEAITAMQERGTSDALTMKRLKKRKLMLKDHIARIEDELTPDIIA